jgi:hypothetical protein
LGSLVPAAEPSRRRGEDVDPAGVLATAPPDGHGQPI